ncbi:MAG TPA: hypothetical protein VEA59_01880 [Patescibacteria group bacterium]|nr:hypothetical protein [Patescibacteria group bacterium]
MKISTFVFSLLAVMCLVVLAQRVTVVGCYKVSPEQLNQPGAPVLSQDQVVQVCFGFVNTTVTVGAKDETQYEVTFERQNKTYTSKRATLKGVKQEEHKTLTVDAASDDSVQIAHQLARLVAYHQPKH